MGAGKIALQLAFQDGCPLPLGVFPAGAWLGRVWGVSRCDGI
jgi:hypothetical protein